MVVSTESSDPMKNFLEASPDNKINETPTFSDITTMRVGGAIKKFLEPISADEFIDAINTADTYKENLCVMGGGSNICASDDFFNGTVVRYKLSKIEILKNPYDGERVSYKKESSIAVGQSVYLKVESATYWDSFVAYCVRHQFAGVEALSGIPGTVGATAVQNSGSYGQEIADTFVSARVWDRYEKKIKTLYKDELHFGYRTSKLKKTMYEAPGVACSPYFPSPRFIVLSVIFRLIKSSHGTIKYEQLARALGARMGERAPIENIRNKILEVRAAKNLLEDIKRYENYWMRDIMPSISEEVLRVSQTLNENGELAHGGNIRNMEELPDNYDRWSCGSFFTNPIISVEKANALPAEAPRYHANNVDSSFGFVQSAHCKGVIKVPAAWLIEHSGFYRGWPLKEDPQAPVILSPTQILKISNRGHATFADIVVVASTVKKAVMKHFGVELHAEPVFVGTPDIGAIGI